MYTRTGIYMAVITNEKTLFLTITPYLETVLFH